MIHIRDATARTIIGAGKENLGCVLSKFTLSNAQICHVIRFRYDTFTVFVPCVEFFRVFCFVLYVFSY